MRMKAAMAYKSRDELKEGPEIAGAYATDSSDEKDTQQETEFFGLDVRICEER